MSVDSLKLASILILTLLSQTTAAGQTGRGGGSDGGSRDSLNANIVSAANCTNCSDAFGVAQFLQTFGGTESAASTVLSGTRSKAGDTIVVGFNGYNPSGVTVSRVKDYCGNTFTPLQSLDAFQGNTIQLFYAWNVSACTSDVITVSHNAATYRAVYSWDIRYADNLSNPFDVQATGTNPNGSPIISGNFATSSPNEIIIALAWSHNYASCGTLYVGAIGGTTAVQDSLNAPMNSATCPYNIAEHFVTSIVQSDVTASASWSGGQPGGGIVVAAFRRLATLPRTSLRAKFDAKIATGATWSKGNTVIAVGASDPQPLSSDVGKVIFGTISTSGSDGNMTAGSLVIPQGVITAVKGNQIMVSQAAAAANQPANSDGFTGFVIWCTNDTDALRAAWNACLTTDGGTLALPAGMSCFDGPLFVNTNGRVYNRSIVGVSASGTVLVPLPQFQYDAHGGLGLVYYDYGAGILGTGSAETQKSTGPTQLMNWGIWGADQPGTNVTWRNPPAPFIYAVRTTLINISCGSWNNGFGGKTDSSVPGFVLSGSTAINGQNFACGNAGLKLVQAPTTQFASAVFGGAYGWTWGAGLIISQATSTYAHQSYGAYYGTSDYPDHTISVANCNTALCQTDGNFVSHGDTFYGSLVTSGGSTTLLGTDTAKVNSGTLGLNITGGHVSASGSIIPSFSMTSGSFIDNGFNPRAFGGTAWTTGVVSINGGTVYKSQSVTGDAPTASNWSVPAGSSAGQWGTSPSVACPGTLFAQAGDSHRQSCTIKVGSGLVGSNPVVTVTFPTVFAVAPTCDAQMTGGTAELARFTVGVPTTTSVPLTYHGAPAAGSTIGLVVTCGP
jgi:hypothetical protein